MRFEVVSGGMMVYKKVFVVIDGKMGNIVNKENVFVIDWTQVD